MYESTIHALCRNMTHCFHILKIQNTYLAYKHSLTLTYLISAVAVMLSRLIDCFSCLPPLWLTEMRMPILELNICIKSFMKYF